MHGAVASLGHAWPRLLVGPHQQLNLEIMSVSYCRAAVFSTIPTFFISGENLQYLRMWYASHTTPRVEGGESESVCLYKAPKCQPNRDTLLGEFLRDR